MPPKSVVESSSASRRGPTPKERGCFECSRRRIICDKAEPSCAKCIKKGIECSGVNRIRFTTGVARRGKLKDCKIPDTSNSGVAHLPTTTGFAEVRWPEDRKKRAKRKRSGDGKPVTQDLTQDPTEGKEIAYSNDETDGSSTISPSASADGNFDLPFHSMGSTNLPDSPPLFSWTDEPLPDSEDDVEEIARTEDRALQYHSTYNDLQPWVAPISAQARMLFSYFSEVVAPVMVILDTSSNGYRNIILSMALEDDVLHRAVGVVAAQHLSRDSPEILQAAEAGRVAIISRLRKDAMCATPDQVFNEYTWATLIVLLVGETVTGSADYRFLVQMLLTLSTNSRAAERNMAAARFLQTQTNMFEMISSPVIRESDAVQAIQRIFKSWQDWLTCEKFLVGSEHYRIVDHIRMCFTSACTIYLRRATTEYAISSPTEAGLDDERQASVVKDLVDRLLMIPPDTPGAHALVWPCFVGGAETSDPDQRAFFVDYMNSIYAITKFRNIPAAIQSLENLWASKGDKRWTQCLPEFSKVLVM
ncbi:fungal-specific transcription factor domain-containing protein [Phaeosphaeriaceae sp. PMI808]|nr:fungal-specific transcription factor domain-containing protein [Phaeosphaeriaceae sp. PMI808]